MKFLLTGILLFSSLSLYAQSGSKQFSYTFHAVAAGGGKIFLQNKKFTCTMHNVATCNQETTEKQAIDYVLQQQTLIAFADKIYKLICPSAEVRGEYKGQIVMSGTGIAEKNVHPYTVNCEAREVESCPSAVYVKATTEGAVAGTGWVVNDAAMRLETFRSAAVDQANRWLVCGYGSDGKVMLSKKFPKQTTSCEISKQKDFHCKN